MDSPSDFVLVLWVYTVIISLALLWLACRCRWSPNGEHLSRSGPRTSPDRGETDPIIPRRANGLVEVAGDALMTPVSAQTAGSGKDR